MKYIYIKKYIRKKERKKIIKFISHDIDDDLHNNPIPVGVIWRIRSGVSSRDSFRNKVLFLPTVFLINVS